MTTKLTAKQARFVDEYLIDLNATQAAIRAGFSVRTAEWIGPQVLGKKSTGACESGHGGRAWPQKKGTPGA